MRKYKSNLIILIVTVLAFLFLVGWTQFNFAQINKLLPPQEIKRIELAEQPSGQVKGVFVGDIMLSRKVGRYMEERGNAYPFARITDYLQAGDFTVGNLETAISDRGQPLPGKGIWFRSVPESAQVLQDVGFDLVSLANNHVLDYDTEGLLDTIYHLNEAGVLSVGAGENIEEAVKPVIIEQNGVKIGILAFLDTYMSDIFFSHSYKRMFKAEETIAGVGPMHEELMLEAVRKLRPEVDIVIVSLHWGVEYADYPISAQRELAHKLVENGVDFVHGHHPHCIQGIEIYQEAVIAYSLGNFIFDQNQMQKTMEGLLLEITFSSLGVAEAQIVPVMIVNGQAFPAKNVDAARILVKLQRLSSGYANIVIEGEKAKITR